MLITTMNYKSFDVEDIKQNFDDRGLEIPDIKIVQFKYQFKAPKDFANGGKDRDQCREILDILYDLKDKTYSIHLKVTYHCSIHGHSGGIADFEEKVTKFEYQDDIHRAIIIADHIMSKKSKILKKFQSRSEVIYTAIEKYLGYVLKF